MKLNENWLVALTNLAAIYPIWITTSNGDIVSAMLLSHVAIASFVSHLFECHKHGMPGNGLSPHTSYLLNRWDGLACLLTTLRFIQLYSFYYGTRWMPILSQWIPCSSLAIGFILLRISEYDKYNPELKTRYIICHCAWHTAVFISIGRLYQVLFE
jgi:hypothetical protein